MSLCPFSHVQQVYASMKELTAVGFAVISHNLQRDARPATGKRVITAAAQCGLSVYAVDVKQVISECCESQVTSVVSLCWCEV